MVQNELSVPDAGRLSQVQRLCEIETPYQVDAEQDALFVAAMKEIVAWHRERCPFYAALLASKGFAEEKLESVADCASVPFVHANFFKTHEIRSVEEKEIVLTLTSSGTTGQRSQMFFDAWSIRSAQRMVDWVFANNGWITPDRPTNYLLFGYEVTSESRVGTAFTSNFLCKFAPVNRGAWALRLTGSGRHEFDLFGCIRTLEEFAQEGLPVRIIGFPAFTNFTLERMRSLGVGPLSLSADSLVFMAGGWKGHADKQIPKLELYARVTEQLGIPDERCRNAFGSVEHCIPYIECSRHHLHVPVWSRVFVRDVRTLEVVGYDRPGFLHFVSPYITSVPAHSVVMGDLVTLQPGEACGCGVATPFFEVLGRAGTSRNRSCAVAAAELLKRISV